MILALAWCQQFQQYDSEVPAVLSYNSPLRQPDSLRSRPYFDFLSTLYRRDADKSQLFRPYVRSRRSAVSSALPVHHERSKRAIVFRPLFVYRQQEVRRQQYQNQRRHRV